MWLVVCSRWLSSLPHLIIKSCGSLVLLMCYVNKYSEKGTPLQWILSFLDLAWNSPVRHYIKGPSSAFFQVRATGSKQNTIFLELKSWCKFPLWPLGKAWTSLVSIIQAKHFSDRYSQESYKPKGLVHIYKLRIPPIFQIGKLRHKSVILF